MGIPSEAQLIVPKIRPLVFDTSPVICLAGKTGAGKSVVARYLSVFYGLEWVRTRNIIHELLIEDIEAAMVGMLTPEFEEVITGEAEVREVFRVPRVGAVAGCSVRSGVITRGSKVRFLRDGVVIWKGAITSLRRFKDDVREVREGFECGIGLSDFQDLKAGDIIETFEERLIPRS